MSFGQAIQDGFRKYAQFSGRSSRSAYWYWVLFGFIVGIVDTIVDSATKSIVFGLIVSLALLIPNIAVLFRRLHDTGRSGWWWLIVLIPLIGAIVLLVFTVQASDGPNQYGAGADASPGAVPAY